MNIEYSVLNSTLEIMQWLTRYMSLGILVLLADVHEDNQQCPSLNNINCKLMTNGPNF